MMLIRGRTIASQFVITFQFVLNHYKLERYYKFGRNIGLINLTNTTEKVYILGLSNKSVYFEYACPLNSNKEPGVGCSDITSNQIKRYIFKTREGVIFYKHSCIGFPHGPES